MTISASIMGAGFAMEAPLPGEIAPGEESTFRTQFSAPLSGAFTGQAQIVSNGPESCVFPLSRTGLTASERWRRAQFRFALNTRAGADGNDTDGD